MGRHDSRDPAPFYASLGGAVLRGLLALFVSFGLYAVLLTFRGDEQPSPPPTPVAQAPAVVASETPPPTRTAKPQPRVPHETVQVLDAGAGERRTEEVVERLEGYGYEIVAVNEAARTYGATTVFYSAGQQSAAEALRDRDERFVEIKPNRDLSDEVDLHVLVGTDWE
jgi:hypothetical protein